MTILEKLGITPGPWKVEIEDELYGDQVFIIHPETECDETTICVSNYGLPNAKLMAKAPEMLEALIDLLIDKNNYSYMYEECVEIIESATGKTWDEIKGMREES